MAPLPKGDILRIFDNERWDRKVQVQNLMAPRSYAALTEDSQVLRRDGLHLRNASEVFSISIGDSDLECNSGYKNSLHP